MTNKKRILFVEDDPVVARIYRQKIADAGYEIQVAEDGLLAMRGLAEYKPDLVVLDLMIPKLNGVDVLKYMRQRSEFDNIRVIVFSNAFLNELWDSVAALKPDEMLLKSQVTPPGLVETIGRILKRPRAFREAPQRTPAPEPPPAPAAAPAPKSAPKKAREPGHFEDMLEFRTRIRREFMEQIPAIANGLQLMAREFLDSVDAAETSRRLEVLARKADFLTHMTSMAGCHRIAELASALEALLIELLAKPVLINPSTRHTLGSTVAFLANCLNHAENADAQCLAPMTVLAVDDDEAANRAVTMALSRSNMTVTCETDPIKALPLLRQNAYDVVLLDIDMPRMSGLTLCEGMRQLPLHRRTPVIFITVYGDFQMRVRSIQSGGDDLIAKPILPVELTVKVTMHVLKYRMGDTAP